MYLGVDIGGTKTLVACFDDEGVLQEEVKFPTPSNYNLFLKELANVVDKLSTTEFRAAAVAVPGKIDRERGTALAFGNLPWKDVSIESDIKRIARCSVAIENDAKLAALSEALLMPDCERVLYITISTGIGIGIVERGQIDAALMDAEGGSMLLDHKRKLEKWESFASGKAITERYGKHASEIHDPQTWREISRNLAEGIIELIAIIQPDVIVLGGSVGAYFERFQPYLEEELKKYATALTPIPPIYKAKRPAEAVIYGCYELAKRQHG